MLPELQPVLPGGVARAFIAVEIGAEAKDALERAVERLRTTQAQVKWVSRQNWHLTLNFLGDVERVRLAAIGQALREETAHVPAFEIALRGLQPFPPGRQPRIVAASVMDGNGGLAKLNARLEARLKDFGVPAERRGFHAHLTLGRVNGSRGLEELWQTVRTCESKHFGTSRVSEVVLFESELLPQGARYAKLETAPLA